MENKKYKGHNRRKYARITTNIPCMLRDVYTATAICDGYILDFGFGGLGVGTNHKLEMGAEVVIETRMSKDNIELNVRIVNERRIMSDIFVYGTQFVGFTFFKMLSFRKRVKKFEEEQQ